MNRLAAPAPPAPRAADRRAGAARPAVAMPVVFDARVVTGSGGGPDKTILNSPRFLDPLGYRMVCGYLHPPGDLGYDVIVRRAAEVGAPLVSIPDRGPWDWRVVADLVAVLRRENVAVWHGHDYKTNALGLLLRRFHPMRLVTTVHGWVRQTARTPVYYRIDKLCLPRYERVFCVSEDLFDAALAAGVPAGRCVLLENGIDAAGTVRRNPPAGAKQALGFDPARPLIGAVGRLSPEKGFDVLLAAVKQLADRGRDVQLVIVGEGDDRPRLEALAVSLGVADRVRLAGWETDVRSYYEAMDVFALSSLREGLPNVVLEAMALEVPVVATRIAGVPRLVEDGRTGLLVEPGDADGLSRSLGGLLGNPGLADLFRAAGRRAVETRFSFAARMSKLAGAYDELLAK